MIARGNALRPLPVGDDTVNGGGLGLALNFKVRPAKKRNWDGNPSAVGRRVTGRVHRGGVCRAVQARAHQTGSSTPEGATSRVVNGQRVGPTPLKAGWAPCTTRSRRSQDGRQGALAGPGGLQHQVNRMRWCASVFVRHDEAPRAQLQGHLAGSGVPAQGLPRQGQGPDLPEHARLWLRHGRTARSRGEQQIT